MLTVTKWVTSEFFSHKHPHTDLIDFLSVAVTAKYNTPMFQEFRTHAYSMTVLFPIWVYAYALFFKALLDSSVSCHSYEELFSKTVSIKLFLVMVLNLYLTPEWSQSKSDFVVAVL